MNFIGCFLELKVMCFSVNVISPLIFGLLNCHCIHLWVIWLWWITDFHFDFRIFFVFSYAVKWLQVIPSFNKKNAKVYYFYLCVFNPIIHLVLYPKTWNNHFKSWDDHFKSWNRNGIVSAVNQKTIIYKSKRCKESSRGREVFLAIPWPSWS